MDVNATGVMLKTMLFLVNHTSADFMYNVFNETLPQPVDLNEIRCFGAYGCFPVNYPWTAENRPHSVFPFSPAILNVKFLAYNRKHLKTPKLLDINDPYTILDAGFNPNHPIFFVTHGFLEFGGAPWIKKMIQELLIYDKHSTVIAIDWRGGSSPPFYQAVANIRLVGAVVAHCIATIYEELKLPDLEKIHLIGHSLGAHMSGYAGFYLQRDFELKVGRITGLDPAGPYFLDTEEIVRLDPSDAKYVDIIHSDASMFVEGGFGIKQSIGHLDFFPNGGDNQPRCQHSVGTCDHVHSVELFTESINSKCPFQSIICESYEAFKKGKCRQCNRNAHYCVKFGFHSHKSYVSLFSKGFTYPGYRTAINAYLMTSEKEPYCKSHFNVFVKIAENDESRIHGGEIGFLFLKLIGMKGEGSKFKLNQQAVFFQPGSNHTFHAIGDDVEEIKSVTVDYKYKSTVNPLTWRVFTPKIYIEYLEIESMEHTGYLKVCPHHGLPISSGEGLLFREDSCNYRRDGK